MSNIFILADKGVVVMRNENPWTLILLVLVFVLKENNTVSNIFILADEGAVVEMRNEIPWALIQHVLVFVLKENNTVSNIFEGVVMEMGN